MVQPIQCPVCGKSSIEPVLQSIKIVASYERFEGDIGGLKVYRCKENGHIFFVRGSDLENEGREILAS